MFLPQYQHRLTLVNLSRLHGTRTMTPNKFQRLFLRQYRELHEAPSPKRVILIRQLRVFLGAVLMVGGMAVLLLFVAGPALAIFIPFGVGLILGNSASNLGALFRRGAAWSVVEEITNWPKVYELLDGTKDRQK
jgi:hypothetical protein